MYMDHSVMDKNSSPLTRDFGFKYRKLRKYGAFPSTMDLTLTTQIRISLDPMWISNWKTKKKKYYVTNLVNINSNWIRETILGWDWVYSCTKCYLMAGLYKTRTSQVKATCFSWAISLSFEHPNTSEIHYIRLY